MNSKIKHLIFWATLTLYNTLAINDTVPTWLNWITLASSCIGIGCLLYHYFSPTNRQYFYYGVLKKKNSEDIIFITGSIGFNMSKDTLDIISAVEDIKKENGISKEDQFILKQLTLIN